jgi:putative membrane protein
MGNLLIRWLINALALGAAAMVLPGIHVDGGWQVLAVTALIFGLVNALIRPLITILTCPLILLSLGLFTLVVNAGMLWLASWLAGLLGFGFKVDGFWPAFLGGLIVTVVSAVLSLMLGDRWEHDRRRHAQARRR